MQSNGDRAPLAEAIIGPPVWKGLLRLVASFALTLLIGMAAAETYLYAIWIGVIPGHTAELIVIMSTRVALMVGCSLLLIAVWNWRWRTAACGTLAVFIAVGLTLLTD